MGRIGQAEQAAQELVTKGTWTDGNTEWTVVHHANVIRQSLAAQIKKREGDKEYQKERRKVGTEKPRKVGADIGSDVVATQTDRQTDMQPRRRQLV